MKADVSGMLLFDKPPGWTSHDAVSALRRLLPDNEKAGHCGTLDPLATGLLIILAGRTRRLQAHMQGLDKVYYGTIQLGISTDTADVTGKITEKRAIPDLSLSQVQQLLESYKGSVSLPAPIFSAVKHKGKPLYHYARKGIVIPPKPLLPKREHKSHLNTKVYFQFLRFPENNSRPPKNTPRRSAVWEGSRFLCGHNDREAFPCV